MLFINNDICYNQSVWIWVSATFFAEITEEKRSNEELFMLNEEKIKIMNKLAMYEQGEGKKYLPVSRYYRSDYIGLALIKNFFLVTIGYCLILAGIAAYFGEYLVDNIHKMDLVAVGRNAVIGYVVVLVVFSVATYIQYSVKYHKAKKSVKEYYQELTQLNKIYSREEKKSSFRGVSGGYKK